MTPVGDVFSTASIALFSIDGCEQRCVAARRAERADARCVVIDIAGRAARVHGPIHRAKSAVR